MMEIKRIGVLSAAKIVGGVYAGLGLIIGLFSACFGLIAFAGLISEADAEFAGFGAGLFLAGLCFWPIVYGVLGFIGGAIAALIYNVVAGFIGGLELELSEKM
jgi:hypothetical protein